MVLPAVQAQWASRQQRVRVECGSGVSRQRPPAHDQILGRSADPQATAGGDLLFATTICTNGPKPGTGAASTDKSLVGFPTEPCADRRTGTLTRPTRRHLAVSSFVQKHEKWTRSFLGTEIGLQRAGATSPTTDGRRDRRGLQCRDADLRSNTRSPDLHRAWCVNLGGGFSRAQPPVLRLALRLFLANSGDIVQISAMP